MLYSMTGFGKSAGHVRDSLHVSIEIRSYNGKKFELNQHCPASLRPFQALIHKSLQEILERGSIDFSIALKQGDSSRPMTVNKELAGYYYEAIQQLAKSLSLPLPGEEILPTLMTLPEVISISSEEFDESAWAILQPLVVSAADGLKQYRLKEGAAIEKDLLLRIANIEHFLSEIKPLEEERIHRIRERIESALLELTKVKAADENRFEQELIYYLEKIDFSEEKQRLAVHCSYFKELCQTSADEGMGKKLGFVLQEIGREINTLGSKANDATIQKIVVNMKDELEKAKEQVLNVL